MVVEHLAPEDDDGLDVLHPGPAHDDRRGIRHRAIGISRAGTTPFSTGKDLWLMPSAYCLGPGSALLFPRRGIRRGGSGPANLHEREREHGEELLGLDPGECRGILPEEVLD